MEGISQVVNNNLSCWRPPAAGVVIAWFTLQQIPVVRRCGCKISSNPGFRRDNKSNTKYTVITEGTAGVLVLLAAFSGLVGFAAAAGLILLVFYGAHLARVCFNASPVGFAKTRYDYHYNKQKRQQLHNRYSKLSIFI